MQSVLARIQLRRTVAHVPDRRVIMTSPVEPVPELVSGDLVATLTENILIAANRGVPTPSAVYATLAESPPAVGVEVRERLRRVAEAIEGEWAEPDHCPRCGGVLKPDTSLYLLRCSKCTRQWPPRVRPEVYL